MPAHAGRTTMRATNQHVLENLDIASSSLRP
jgi:hypothetical protein